ncbi:alpha/beta hydrolase [Devosia sp.]|uniref:alpha/beta fold hydrolase n=1 Tax=Devosia sp. TaxID=1871048 RepID=UPI002638EC91|nr:alpha/beta hydrolase [Devosia sp.]
MNLYDDDLVKFEAEGVGLPPDPDLQGHVLHDRARIWYATYGAGPAVILLHGGMGHSGNLGNQVPDLVRGGHRVVVIDSRGHGRSTRDERPYSYQLMASDVLAVMNELQIDRAAFVGWSDGACIALVLAHDTPERSAGVFFFACNMDPSGTRPFEFTPVIGRCLNRHTKDYEALSATPDQFKAFSDAVGEMQRTQPNYSARELGEIKVPVVIAQAEHDEFIKLEHAEYLARSIPRAQLVLLPGVSHFAPLQRPDQFNRAVGEFLDRVSLGSAGSGS